MDLVIRVDSSIKIGTGHLMRCLALGQAWKDKGGRVLFIIKCPNELLLNRLYKEGFEVHQLDIRYSSLKDWEATERLLNTYYDGWLILDGYHFDSNYQRRVKDAGKKFMVIDDIAHLSHYHANIILNQNIYAKELKYSCEPYTKLLLGTKYVLLRREFLKWSCWKRKTFDIARKVLVTLGGSDPDNVTLKVIQALHQVKINGLEAVVVIGASNPHYEMLKTAVQSLRLSVRLESNATNMPELMAWADIAISSGGITSWELAFMGLPTLVLVISDNQRLVAEYLEKVGAFINLGWKNNISSNQIACKIAHLLSESELRAKMTQRCWDLVDGEGAERIIMHLKGEKLRLRRAREEDCKLLWKWANDPEVRAMSFSSSPIAWEEHVEWFKRKLHSSNCVIFIGLDENDIPVGQVRFDIINNRDAEININVDRSKRGQGYGGYLIKKSVEKLFHNSGIKFVHAFIKPENITSIKAFESAKFIKYGIKSKKGNLALHYIKCKDAK